MNSKSRLLAGMTPVQKRQLLADLLKARLVRAGMSFAQERLWFLHQLSAKYPVYNIPAVVRLSGPLDAVALELSLNEIVSRHEVLRTTFERAKDGPVPVVREAARVALVSQDLTEIPAAERTRKALERANHEARLPFDLERGPLLRALLLRLGKNDHLMVLTLHHITAEAWSVALLFQELEQLYAAYLKGDASPLNPLPIQYSDYARWQRERVQGALLETELNYWRRQLAGDLPLLELPANRARPAVSKFGGAWKSRYLKPELRRAAEALAQSRGVTLFTLLLAAFKALLQRYTGQCDILVGTPVAGRDRADVEPLIGVFMNTLVMRSDLSGDPGFDELLGRVRETVTAAFSHQQIPFELVVEQLRPERNISHTPIFQVMFAMQNTPLPVLELAGLLTGEVLDPGQVHNGTSKVDLAMFVEEAGAGLMLGCEYSTDLFDGETIERLLEHYEVLLAAALENPACRLSRLNLLSGQELHKLLVEFNDTAADRPERVAHEWFEMWAAETPDAVAVVDDEHSFTYAQLDRQANRLARFLETCGVSEESRVALLTPPSSDMVLTMLAVAKAGATYVPLDPAYPSRRLAFMIEDAGVKVVLTHQSMLERLPATEAHVVCLDRDRVHWSAQGAEPLRRPSHLDRLAYLIYTSGSTGRPKAVEIEHRGLANLVQWHKRAYSLGPADRGTQLAGLAFDACVWEVWPCLASGAAICIASERTRLSPVSILEFLQAKSITVAFLATPLAEALLQGQWPARSVLRYMLTGGSRLHCHAVAGAPYQLVNHYGPTENTVVTTAALVDSPSSVNGSPSIGRPISNHRSYILDAQLQPVPLGVPGELYVGGPGLARCYHGRPGLTAGRFLPDPFGAQGRRLFATGDMARYKPDGQIEFIGRRDGQIKVRGYRVELGEIESALRAHPGVREAVVMPVPDGGGHTALAAYVTCLGDDKLPVAELRSFLRDQLPAYMIPAVFIQLAEMPLTSSGKIERDALPKPGGTRATTAAAGQSAPKRAIERQIAELWREVLPDNDIGLHDSFFDLGGHSLTLVEVHARLSRIVDCELSVVDLFRFPTISSLAAHIENRQPLKVDS